MSIEEDTELRDIVLETLDQRGVVGKTKAMLRANIFTALEETAAPHDKIYLLNKRLKENLATLEGTLMAGLIIDYFNCLELEFSKTVFEPETGFDSNSTNRTDMCSSLGISSPLDGRQPVLSEVIKRLHSGGGGSEDKPTRRQLPGHSMGEYSIPEDLTAKQLSDAKAKFSHYDKDGSGTIDKDELRQLFIDMFPNFHRNMLERYVTDEFRAADTDFSAGIDYEEFLDLYRRLFISCRSVVSHDVSDIVTVTTPRSPSPRQSKIPVKSEQQSSGNSKKDNSPSPRHSAKSPGSAGDYFKLGGSGEPSSGGFLSDPPVFDKKTLSTADSPTGKKADPEMKSIDRSLADLGFDIPDDDEESIKTKSGYEEDFEKSITTSSDRSRKRSYSESINTGDSVSTEDITDKIGGDDDDDIDALLKDNDISWGNETEDKSVTDDSSLKGVDYWEVVPKK